MAGIDALTKAIEAVRTSIVDSKGKITIKEEPRAVSERDDRLLAAKLEELANAKEGDGGDSDSDEDQEGMGNIDVEAAPALAV
eukprot:scaffold1733_cov391-Prasinococcus_capsulatus_cf.AAC.3